MNLFLDVYSIIYLIESHQQQGQNAQSLITQVLNNKTQLIVQRLSFLECRVLPLKEKNDSVLESYDQFLNRPACKLYNSLRT